MEKNVKICKGCNEPKIHILDVKYDYKNKRYIDEEGRQWNGRFCPSCHNLKMKSHMRGKRITIKVVPE